MKEIYCSETKKGLFEKTPMHSKQQLPALLEHFCTKLVSDCKEFDSEMFFLHCMIFAGPACKDVWHIMHRNIFRNLPASSVRIAF